MKKLLLALLAALSILGAVAAQAKADDLNASILYVELRDTQHNVCTANEGCKLVVYRAKFGNTKTVSTGSNNTYNLVPFRYVIGDYNWSTITDPNSRVNANAYEYTGVNSGRFDFWGQQPCVGVTGWQYSDTISVNAESNIRWFNETLWTGYLGGCHPGLGVSTSPLSIEAGLGAGPVSQ